MKLPWMSRSDRSRWRSARTVADLGELMARWLEGEIASRPGYQARYGPEDETEHLVPTLAALCRAGYVTTCSQPGVAGTGVDGMWWEQRAAVELVVVDPALCHRLVDAAIAAGLFVRINDHRLDSGGVQEPPVVATTRDGEAMTAFGGRISRADMAIQWPGLNRDLYRQVSTGTYVSVIAPEYGPDGDRLWTVLDRLTGRHHNDPWASRTRPTGTASR
ncbi:DUF6919 domain-containing protein [Streptomyces geranii]|uniref:DUF6919 domain-containing protein n=1 Tax=Streptomyces geranii TaxID=2058923 RepID=UPI000D030E0A|nr:hypothetical protein [Streptomyces geranii]